MDRMGRTIAVSLQGIALFALAHAAPAQTPPASPPHPAAEPQLLSGTELESTLLYDADPKLEHLLRASFAGKEHARLWLGSKADEQSTRLLRLRSGERVFGLLLASGSSVELSGQEREEALGQFELRRALVQFDQLAWTGEGMTRTATLGALGSLTARFAAAEDSRPVEIDLVDAKGVRGDSCRAIRWNRGDAGTYPAALEFWHADQRVWKETVERVQAKTFARSLFLPREAREGAPGPTQWKILSTPAPEYAGRRFELKEGATWESARKELARLRSEWTPKLAALGLELEKRGTLELDEGLHPRFVVLRLTTVPATLPEGFERVAGRSAVGTQLEGFEKLAPGALQALRAKVPAGSPTGMPYVRWILDPGGERQILLLLPWASAR